MVEGQLDLRSDADVPLSDDSGSDVYLSVPVSCVETDLYSARRCLRHRHTPAEGKREKADQKAVSNL